MVHFMYCVILICSLHLPITCIQCNKESSNVENSLKQHLLCNGYDSKKAPNQSENETIRITTNAVMYRIEIDESSRTIEVDVLYEMIWMDASLQWNSSEWSNVDTIHLNYDEVWIPRFENIQASLTSESTLTCANPQCYALHFGIVRCVPICKISARCASDLARWPYHTQDCRWWFDQNEDKQVLNKIRILAVNAAKQTVANGKRTWCVTSIVANTTAQEYPSGSKHTVKVFTIGLNHNPHTAIVGVYSPVLALAIFNLTISWLNSFANERTKLASISLVYHCLHLTQVTWPALSPVLPATSLFIIGSTIAAYVLFVITLFNRCLYNLPIANNSNCTKIILNSTLANCILDAEYLSIGHKKAANSHLGSQLVKLIDHVVFVVHVFVYLALFVTCIPMRYEKPVKNASICAN